MQTLKKIVKKENISVSCKTSIHDASQIMYANAEGCVVLLEGTQAVGILTERDLVSFVDNHVNMQESVINVAKKNVISINIERSIEYALHILIDNNIRRLVILNQDDEFIGIVTQEMMIAGLEAEHYRVNLKVSQILSNSGKNIVTLPYESTLKDAIALMHYNNIGSILVTENAKVEGIITERDVVRFVSQKISTHTAITDIMTSPVLSVNINDSVEHIVKLMQEKRVRRVVVEDNDTTPIGLIGTRDIIKNIKGNYGIFVENKLKYTKQALNAINEVIFELYSDKGVILVQWANDIAIERYGSDIIDQSITRLIDEKIWLNILSILSRENTINDYKISIQNQLYLLSCSQCSTTLNDRAFFIICKDVTEYELKLLNLNKTLDTKVKEEVAKNKHQEEQLFAQSRMMQMGEMISMIAHQWRQPLGAISTTAVNLQMKIELDSFDLVSKEGLAEARQYFLQRLENINDYVENLSTTIDDFRNFYKPNKESQNIPLEDVISKSLHIIQASLANDNIEVIQEYNSGKAVRLYDSEMMQVILNLLKNAQDNFKEKSIKDAKITIKTQDNAIFICDNGGGISKKIIDKIFDPYFSTKNEKNGTGLGLYMSKIIIEEHHNGLLHVSNTDDGVCFKIEVGAL